MALLVTILLSWKLLVMNRNLAARNYGILLRFHSTSIYFANFWFRFWSFRKFTTKFRSLLKWFKMLKFWTKRWQKLKKSILHISMLDCYSLPSTSKLVMHLPARQPKQEQRAILVLYCKFRLLW